MNAYQAQFVLSCTRNSGLWIQIVLALVQLGGEGGVHDVSAVAAVVSLHKALKSTVGK